MGSTARTGHDDPQAAVGRLRAPGQHVVRHPVGRHDVDNVRDAELGEHLRSRGHHRPVGVRAHHHAHERWSVGSRRSFGRRRHGCPLTR